MIRILFVHHSTDIGGAGLSLLYLIQKLDRSKFDPFVFFNAPPGPLLQLFEQNEIPYKRIVGISTYGHAYGARYEFRSVRPWEPVTKLFAIFSEARKFKSILENEQYDIIHINSIVQVQAAIGAKLTKKKAAILWHLREEIYPGIFGIRKFLLRKCVDRVADVVISISHWNARQLNLPSRTHVVYNFVDFKKFDQKLSKAHACNLLGLDPSKRYVLFLGGMVASKGVDTFLKAIEKINTTRELGDVIFLIAGKAPTEIAESPNKIKRAVRRMVASTGFIKDTDKAVIKLLNGMSYKDNIKFIGVRKDVEVAIASCAILVWPAKVSHFARPIIEAGVMGKAVVASDFSSSRELVVTNETGYLVPHNDPDQFADKIKDLLNDETKLTTFGEKAYALACSRYQADVNTQSIVKIYESVLSTYEK